MKKYSWLYLFAILAFVVSTSGCGPKTPYPIVPLKGTVSYQGQPVPEGFLLEFQPAGEGRPSSAKIGAGGQFEAVYRANQNGVQKGEHKVHILWGKNPETDPAPEEYQPMLDKYGYGTEGKSLTIEKKDANFKLDFE